MILSVITQIMSFLETDIIIDCLYNLNDANSVVFEYFFKLVNVGVCLDEGKYYLFPYVKWQKYFCLMFFCKKQVTPRRVLPKLSTSPELHSKD